MTTTKKPTLPTPIDSITHHETRVNIPTEEMRDFVPDDAGATATTLLYPRDPSLDPQLVWKGKDAQDAADLAVPVVPVYIQEKIHPKAIIENLRAEAAGSVPQQASLFADFDGLAFEEMVEFYQHEQHWANRLILGDALLVMTSLAEKEGLKGKVQTIYMDPPYGIKFGSNWQVSTRKRDVKDGKAEDATRQPEQIRAFRDTWELGIHSYLAYLRDRMTAARDLLTENGSIFVQIGDENVHLVRSILDEVFGSENSVSIISVRKTGGTTGDFLSGTTDFILWYAREKPICKYRPLFVQRGLEEAFASGYQYIEVPEGKRRRATTNDLAKIKNGDPARLWLNQILTSPRIRESRSGYFPIEFEGKSYLPTAGEWKTNREGIERLITAKRIASNGSSLGYVRFANDFPAVVVNNLWSDMWGASNPIYVVQTTSRLIERCLMMTTDPGDLVLDPTCGSGTTAYVAEQWGRRWITIDTSRVALALARTRLMAARFPYYLLSDTPEGAKKEAEITGTNFVGAMLESPSLAGHALSQDRREGDGGGQAGEGGSSTAPTDGGSMTSGPMGDVRKGFVYKRVPHVTLKSIANNEEIDAIHARWQAQMEPLRAELNAATGQAWEEWQVPREAGVGWSEAATRLHEQGWAMRRARQAEIDASIAKRAETELLYDQPYEDAKRIRVTGPFTVESLSPHRVVAPDDERPATEKEGAQIGGAGEYETGILDNLRKAGVQNTVKQERLTFDRLDPYAGTWIQAEGDYTESGAAKRVAVSIGPQYGTVDKEWIREASKEAVQGIGFSLLIVCGFAFDAAVSEETRKYGKLTILIARMNPDLTMGDALLKKTGAGNLFMVFGEPDILISDYTDGTLKVEIRGVDVYDPTTGQIRSHTTDDIACWFIDTDYNGESFFVRHAYFTGADAPYDKLKRALRAEIDESAWASLYATVSRPFDKPTTGKIAVKVINHYGDEVLKVYGV